MIILWDPIWLNALFGPRVPDDRNRNSIASENRGCSYVHIISYPTTTSSVQFYLTIKKTALIFFSKRMKVGKEGIIIKLACGEVRKKKKVPSDDQSK